jgi:hypothetical protein
MRRHAHANPIGGGHRFDTRECPPMAQSRHELVHCTRPLSGLKRTYLFALHMSAIDPKRTSAGAVQVSAFSSGCL